MQRHGASSSECATPQEKAATGEPSRKGSLTQGKRDLFRREKSRDDGDVDKKKPPMDRCDSLEHRVPPLTKQKSIGLDAAASTNSNGKSDFFKSLSKDKSKGPGGGDTKPSCSQSVKSSTSGVRKSDSATLKTKDQSKVKSSNFSFRTSKGVKSGGGSFLGGKGKEDKKQINRDDFLKATMRIFLVVSPPVGKMQVI